MKAWAIVCMIGFLASAVAKLKWENNPFLTILVGFFFGAGMAAVIILTITVK